MMIELICDNCKNKIYRKTRKRGKHCFCSKDCEILFRHKEAYIEKECPICGKKFETARKRESTYCSLACQIEWQRRFPRVGKEHPCYDHSVNHTIICEWCGTEFETGAYQVKHGKKFCSNDCRRTWYAKVWSQTEEWRQNRRDWAISELENGNASQTQSAPQIIINNLLDIKNIEYQNEKSYKSCAVDNYLIEKNLIIEVMGTYFHCDIRKYNIISYANQVTRIRMDKIKHSYISNNFDIEILYLWEKDINNNLLLCEKLIDKYIMCNGKLKNYHSINYFIEKDKLLLSKNIILPYMDWEISEINKIVNIETKMKLSHKQEDKWTLFNCDNCGKQKEELISHYNKKKNHFCNQNCFIEYRRNNK
jgi:hypothetical protein